MKRVFTPIFAMFVIAVVISAVGCKRYEEPGQGVPSDGIMRVAPAIHSTVAESRAESVSASKSEFVSGDKFGMYVSRSVDSLVLGSNMMRGYEYSNILYTRDASAFTTANTIYYPYREVKVDLWGIYPYDVFATSKKADSYVWSVEQDQSTEAAVLKSDLLVGRTSGVSPSVSDAVNLQFLHKTSRLRIELLVPEEIDGKVLDKTNPIDEIYFENMYLAGSYNFNLDSLTAVTSGEKLSLTPLARGSEAVSSTVASEGTHYYYEALAIPQKVVAGALFVRLKVNYVGGGQSLFLMELDAPLEIIKGKQHTYEISFDDNVRLRLDGSKILDWDEVSEVSSDLDESETVLLGGVLWARGNLVGDGVNGAKIGSPSDGGLYFQFGSLVGYAGGADGTGVGTCTKTNEQFWGGATFDYTKDVAVVPSVYAPLHRNWPSYDNVASGGFGYFYFPDYATKGASFRDDARWRNTSEGIGDPCEYYLGRPWRLPTETEFSVMVGSASETNVAWGDASINGAWTDSGYGGVAGAWFGPNAKKGNASVATDLFIPASGFRVAEGSFGGVGRRANYWSESVNNVGGGYNLYFGSGIVNPLDGGMNRRGGLSARCVQNVQVAQAKPNPPTADQIVTIGNLKWTTGNLVAAGTNGAKVGKPEDGGLYFQFGSVLGWKGGASGDGTGVSTKADGAFYGGSSFNAANEVAVVPSVAAATIAAIGTTWPSHSVNSYYFGLSSYATAYASLRDFAGFAAGALADKGVGDPCTYYLGGTWRLPTAEEFKTMSNNAINEADPSDANAAWTTSPSPGMNFNIDGTKLFIPASGCRTRDNGAVLCVGTDGYYNSESVLDATYRYHLHFSTGTVNPQNSNFRRDGLPARCVADGPTTPTPPTADQIITIGSLKWTTGNLVANGPVNAKVGAPTDYGLYFQFGSLVGWCGGADGSGVGTGEPALAFNIRPTGYTGGAEWTTCGYYSGGVDGEVLPVADVAATGVGDPCRFYLGGGWRTPTTAEFLSMCNNAANGAAWGDGVNAAWQASPAGGNFNNNGTKLFIPASGCRNRSDGSFNFVGTSGYYWSASNGYCLDFHSRSVYSQNGSHRRYGFPVRCVQ